MKYIETFRYKSSLPRSNDPQGRKLQHGYNLYSGCFRQGRTGGSRQTDSRKLDEKHDAGKDSEKGIYEEGDY